VHGTLIWICRALYPELRTPRLDRLVMRGLMHGPALCRGDDQRWEACWALLTGGASPFRNPELCQLSGSHSLWNELKKRVRDAPDMLTVKCAMRVAGLCLRSSTAINASS
jgi:hypothetical protein